MRRPTWPILTVLCLLLMLPAAASAAGRVEVRKGVVYGSARVSAPAAGSTELLLDLYRPAKRAKVARPVVILIHGGGFVGGSRTDPGIVRVARGLAERGVVVASIDYRLMGQKPVPSRRVASLMAAVPKVPIFVAMTTAVDDTLSAVDYLRAHARRLRIDPSRLGLIGSSAGAITANHVGYALDDHGIKGPKVRLVASLWGGMFVPAPAALGPDAAAQLERGEADLFAVHGDADRTLPVTLDDQLVARARRQRVRNEYHRIPGGGHGYDASGFFTRAVVGEQTPYDRLLRFAEARLRKRPSLASSAGAGAQALHYAAALEGTDAFIGIAKTGRCFKAYLSDGTGVATLSVWFEGCLEADGRRLSAERGGVRIDADVDRRRASGTITLRDGRSLQFVAKSGDPGGIVGRRFTHQGKRYRSGWVVLGDNQVRWAITPIGRGLYGGPPAPAADPCAAGRAERDLLRRQRGPLLHQSGLWELRINRGRRPTGTAYNRLNQAIAALDERIFAIERQLYECA